MLVSCQVLRAALPSARFPRQLLPKTAPSIAVGQAAVAAVSAVPMVPAAVAGASLASSAKAQPKWALSDLDEPEIDDWWETAPSFWQPLT